MNSLTQQEPDSTLRVHLDTLRSHLQLNNKVTFALACINNALALTNYSRRSNICYLKNHKDVFMKLISQASTCKPDQLQYLLFIINSISPQSPLSEGQEQSVIKLIGYSDIAEQGLSEQLCEQINSFCFRAHHCTKCGQFIVSTVISKLNPAQLIQFINSFSSNCKIVSILEFHYISIGDLIKLSKQYKDSLVILSKIIEIIHWRIANFLVQRAENDEEVKITAIFLAQTGVYHINHHSILSLCGLAYTQLTAGRKNLFVSKNIDAFLRQSVQTTNLKVYIPSKDSFLDNFNQVAEILINQVDIKTNIDFQHLLFYFSRNPFPWRSELQSLSTKRPFFKQLLLRCTQSFQNTAKANRSGVITQEEEIKVASWIPVRCFRSVSGILQKVKISGVFQAFEALSIIQKLNRNHPKYQQLLVKIVQISIENRDFKSLEQVSRIVQNEVSAQTVISKLKQKASIKNIDSNKQSKRYFVLIPLLLNKQQIQTQLIQELQSIFGYETINIELKFYVADCLLRKMIAAPLKKFSAYLTRTIANSPSDSLFRVILYYLKSLQNLSPANLDWIIANFTEEGERILQLLFANLIGSKGAAVCNILFQLQKMNVFGNSWHHVYRWVLLALQQVTDQSLTIDYLELFQMLLQKITAGCLPKQIMNRFQKIVTNNWSKYTHEHYFILESIIELLNQHCVTSFSKKNLPEVSKMTIQHQAFQKTAHSNVDNKNSPLVQFVRNMNWNLFFEHTDRSTVIRTLLQIIKQNDMGLSFYLQFRSSVLKTLLYSILYIYEDGDEIAPKQIDLLVFNTILSENSVSVQHKLLKGLCLQYLSRVPHQINILKLPLSNLLTQGFNQGGWVAAITQILDVVIQSKPKAIGSFKLQNLIKVVLMRLISLQGGAMEQYLDFIEVTCFTEGDYQVFLGQNLKLVSRILNAEMYGSGYRPSLVLFMLEILEEYETQLDPSFLLFLLTKYSNQSNIVKMLLEKLQKQEMSKELIDQHLLMRLVLVHNQDNQIQEKCKNIFDNNIPAANTEKQFVSLFADTKYENCQEMVQKVTNPFALNLSQAQIRAFVEWKHASSKSKKLLNLLYNLPQTNIKIHQSDAFYLNRDYITYLNQSLQVIKNDFALNSFVSYKDSGHLNLKQNKLEKIIFQRLSSIIRGKNTSLQFKSLIIDVAKNSQDLFAIIIDLLVTVLGNYRKYDNYSRANVEIYYNFCRQIVGVCWTHSPSSVGNIKQIVYMFPVVLGDVHQNQTTINHLFRHYFALVQNYKIIEKDIGILKYISKVEDQLVRRIVKQETSVFDYYQKLCTCLEGRNQLNLSQIKTQFFTLPHRNLIAQLQGQITIHIRGLLSEASNKLTVNFVTNYISTILYTLANGLPLDPQTHSNLVTIHQKFQNYGFSEQNTKVLSEALTWLLKKGSLNKKEQIKSIQEKIQIKKQNQDRVVQTPKKEAGQSLLHHYVSRKDAEAINSAEKQEKNQIIKQMQKQYGDLALYQSLRPAKVVQPDENQSKKQAQEAYIRFKQTEQYITIHEHSVVTNTTVLVIDQNIDQNSPKKATQPVESQFDQKNFLEESKVVGPTQQQRTQNLEIAQKIQNQEFSIQSLKDHCKFISFLADLSTISDKQFEQLLISSTSITETVLSHTFYVKKVMDAETVFKLIKIYKHLHVIKGKQNWGSAIVLKILQLCVAMTQKKQKKMQLFGDEQTIKFFKLVVKRALNGQNSRQEIDLLIQILFSCRINTQVYFKEGLFSMVVQLVNRNIHPDLVIDYLNRIDLTSQYINEIYQRDLFNKLMIAVGKQPTNQQERTLLNLWVKLAGKVCINQSIQQKFRSKQLHVKVWQRFKKTTILPEQLNLCFFYSYICVKNEALCEWLIKNKVLQELLLGLKGSDQNDQLYLLFYHFCFNNEAGRDYCFRIKYHSHLIDRVNAQSTEEGEKQPLSKYFFKSLGQMMNSKLYVATFFKEQIAKKLIDIYNNKTEPAVYECLLDFISILQTDSQFDELKKQNFWSSLKIFQYKMNSEATYSYLLQIFLVMIKKGRTKEFNHPQVRSKATLKAQYSINMDGKQLALRFIVALSIKNKENYLTERCVRLLSSIMGFKVSQNQLLLTLEMLKVEGMTKNSDFLAYYTTNNVVSLIVDSFHTFNQQTAGLAIQILTILATNAANSKDICSKMLTTLQKELKNQSNLKNVIELLVSLSQTKENQNTLQNSQIINQLTSVQLLESVKQANAQQEYSQLISTLSQRQLIKNQQLKTVSKIAGSQNIKVNLEKVSGAMTQQALNDDFAEKAYISLREGRKVKMYKTDGSISELIIWITSDRLELNCAVKLSQVVKAKWRLPINQIKKTIVFTSQESQQFVSSVFEKNSGFFSKAPSYQCCLSLLGKNNQFHICFNSKSQRELWMSDLAVLTENAKKLFSKLK